MVRIVGKPLSQGREHLFCSFARRAHDEDVAEARFVLPVSLEQSVQNLVRRPSDPRLFAFRERTSGRELLTEDIAIANARMVTEGLDPIFPAEGEPLLTRRGERRLLRAEGTTRKHPIDPAGSATAEAQKLARLLLIGSVNCSPAFHGFEADSRHRPERC